MDLWNSRYLNKRIKNNVPVYPVGTGATIEKSTVLKLNQYLAPQKKRQLEQYVPMSSVDPLRFKTDEQIIARHQLDGSERILYPFPSNKMEDIFPPDPYRVNLTGNPSKFGGMTHPVSHRNTGAIDLESTDFINWKEGIDMGLVPGEIGASDYLSRALHAPPHDGLDSIASRYEALPATDALEYYEDKKPKYKNKRQLLYRDPISGERKFVNLPEYPNSKAYLQAKEEENSRRDAAMMKREYRQIAAGVEGYTSNEGLRNRPDLEQAFENDGEEEWNDDMSQYRYQEEDEYDNEYDNPFYNYAYPLRMYQLDTIQSNEAELINISAKAFGELERLDEPGTLMVVKALDAYLEQMKTGNYTKGDKTLVEKEIQSDILQIINQSSNKAADLFAQTFPYDITPATSRELVSTYKNILANFAIHLSTNASSRIADDVISANNESTATTKQQFVSDSNSTTSFDGAPKAYGSGGLGNIENNSLDPNVSLLNSSNDNAIHGYFYDPSPKLAVSDFPTSSTAELEKDITDLNTSSTPPASKKQLETPPTLNKTEAYSKTNISPLSPRSIQFQKQVQQASEENMIQSSLPNIPASKKVKGKSSIPKYTVVENATGIYKSKTAPTNSYSLRSQSEKKIG